MLERIVLVYRKLSECQVAACSTGSAQTQKNRVDRICRCWRAARPIVPPPVSEAHLFSGQNVKGQGYEAQQVCVGLGLQTDRNHSAGVVCKPRWFFPVAVPHRKSHASNTKFSHKKQCRREFLHPCECWLYLVDWRRWIEVSRLTVLGRL